MRIAAERKFEASHCSRSMILGMRRALHPDGWTAAETGTNVFAYPHEEAYSEELFEKFKKEASCCSYNPQSDLFDLNFALMVVPGPAQVLWITFKITLHNSEASDQCYLTAQSHCGPTVLKSEPFKRLNGSRHEPEVVKFAEQVLELIVQKVCQSSTWLPKSEGRIEKIYPDSWLPKPKRLFKLSLNEGDRSFEGVLEEC